MGQFELGLRVHGQLPKAENLIVRTFWFFKTNQRNHFWNQKVRTLQFVFAGYRLGHEFFIEGVLLGVALKSIGNDSVN